MGGGFVFADCSHFSHATVNADYRSLRDAIVGALASQGIKASFEKLPNSHPVYHCYFDFDGPPVGADGPLSRRYPNSNHIVRYTEGVETDGRLVTLLSSKFYIHAWTRWGTRPGQGIWWGDQNPTRQLQFGVNTIIFALTQEGSLTHRLLESMR